MDQLELSQYPLKDFDAKPVGANAALVTYVADYSGRVAGEPLQAKSAYGEVWTKSGNGMEASVRSGSKSEVGLSIVAGELALDKKIASRCEPTVPPDDLCTDPPRQSLGVKILFGRHKKRPAEPVLR